ncbi:MAG TPA: hypothetical protein VF865_15580 [Acidobacteriaceae bacterium]
MGGLVSQIDVTGVAGTDLLLRHLDTGSTRSVKLDAGGNVLDGLSAGSYKALLRDGKLNLAKMRFYLNPNERFTLDFSPKVVSGAHESIASSVPKRDLAIDFSETLGPIADWNVDLWLAPGTATPIREHTRSYGILSWAILTTPEEATLSFTLWQAKSPS